MSLIETLNFGWARRLPMIQQAQSTECGLACVGMIAHYFGYQTNLLRLRQQFQTSLKGATLKDVMS
ncbi:MAG: hypothetical protein KA214_04220, partial [Neisseriaceae bacterium]|nr:hypothetical protein [Neisseriaceae bacterium]